jgi:hypothetical protein
MWRSYLTDRVVFVHIQYILRASSGQGGGELDGPGYVGVVALDEGQGLKKLSSFVYFRNSFPLLSAHVDTSSDHNIPLPVTATAVDCSE